MCTQMEDTFPFQSVCVKEDDRFEEARNSLVLKKHVLAYFLACQSKFRVFWYLVLSAVYISRQTGLRAVNDDRFSAAAEYSLSLQLS